MLTSVSPGLHLVEWTRFNVDLPEVAAAHKVQQSGPVIELACGGIGEIGFCQTNSNASWRVERAFFSVFRMV